MKEIQNHEETTFNATETLAAETSKKDLQESKERDLKITNLKLDLWIKPLTFLSVAGSLLAATIALVTFTAQSDKRNLEEHVIEQRLTLDQRLIDDEKSLLSVNIELANKGNGVLQPYAHALVKDKLYKNEGLYLAIYEMPIQNTGLVEYDGGVAILTTHNVLEKYSNTAHLWYDSYRLKPLTAYHEAEVVIVKRKKLYQVISRFFGYSGGTYGWTDTEVKYLYVD